MPHKKRNEKKSYVLKAKAGKYKIILLPVTIITEKIRILKHPKNIAFSIIGIIVCSLIGLVLGGIRGTIVGFAIAVVFLFIIGPTKEKIIERNKKEVS
jgi:membrane associated rhomboid family serine protease